MRGCPPLFVQPPGTVQPLKQSRECGCLSKHLANRRRVWVKKQGHDSLSKPTEGLISLVRVSLRLRLPPHPLQRQSLSGSFTNPGLLVRLAHSGRQAFSRAPRDGVHLARGWLTTENCGVATGPERGLLAYFWAAGTRRQVLPIAVCLAPCASGTASPVKQQVLAIKCVQPQRGYT